MIKKGTIAVRLHDVTLSEIEVLTLHKSACIDRNRKAGTFEIAIEDNMEDSFPYATSRSMGKERYRLATQQERAWREQGFSTIKAKPKFVKGGIYVRTIANNNAVKLALEFSREGVIVKAIENNPKYCYYMPSLSSENFREATERECIEYERGLKNIHDTVNYPINWQLPDKFYMDIEGQVIKFKQIISDRSIVLRNGYEGTFRYYEFKKHSEVSNHYRIVASFEDGKASSLDYTIPIITPKEFIQFFNNPIKTKENGPDLHGENLQNRGTAIGGRPCVSSRKEPAAVTSRLIGNEVRAYKRQTSVRISKVTFNSQLSRDS